MSRPMFAKRSCSCPDVAAVCFVAVLNNSCSSVIALLATPTYTCPLWLLLLLAGWRRLDVCASFVLCFRPAYRVRQTVVQEWSGIPFVTMYRGVTLGILGWCALCVYLSGCAFGYILCTYSNCGDTIHTHYIGKDERC